MLQLKLKERFGWWPVAQAKLDAKSHVRFNLLGPPWLAVGAFVALILFHGMLVAALDRRFARADSPASGRTLTAGRVVVAVAALLALPGFVTAVADLL